MKTNKMLDRAVKMYGGRLLPFTNRRDRASERRTKRTERHLFKLWAEDEEERRRREEAIRTKSYVATGAWVREIHKNRIKEARRGNNDDDFRNMDNWDYVARRKFNRKWS